MPNPKDRAPAREPTPHPELNAVLAHLVGEAKALLGDNFIGAYLQGSFALGDHNENSDCDFIIVTQRDITLDELPAFQAMHAAIHELPHRRWRHGLEGAYAPAAILRRWSPTPRDPPGEARSETWKDEGTSGSPPRAYPFWYLDHGAKHLIRSEHDNTQVVRWCLREKGVTLEGPDPKRLIDPVPTEALKAEVRETMDRCLALDLHPIDNRAWLQFWVGLYCRMAHTLSTGQIASKKAGTAWARQALDPHWTPFIERTQAAGKGTPEGFDPIPAADAAEAKAFARYVIEWTDRKAKAQAVIAARLAQVRGGPPRRDPRGPGGPGRGGTTPPAFRPGQRGRRG
ncbi:nucleotidyltransferase domain-containing protein [Phenylobacterium sp.]|uniref:nucleotidyltransferase domain-containing protein n=1 Tax=Phenylobacterium sp. TaxID=1871053 RepID=UPI002DE401A0|nr:aminoglycoside adenylyltransferase domain-containing protein [Phenylobacterium sp.]